MADENVNGEESSNTNSAESSTGSDSKKKMNPVMAIVVLVAVLVVGFFAVTFLGRGGKSDEESMTSVVDQEIVETGAESTQEAMGGEASEVVTVKLEAGSFYFKPNVIRAKLGQTVMVDISAVSLQHSFVIDELNVKSATIPSGQGTIVEFVADTLGEFEFYCAVGNHKQQGMVGTLIVVQ